MIRSRSSIQHCEEPFRGRRKDESEPSDDGLTRRHRRRRRSCSTSEERVPKRSRRLSDQQEEKKPILDIRNDSLNNHVDAKDPLEDIIAAREGRKERRHSGSPLRNCQNRRFTSGSETGQDDRYRRGDRDHIDNDRRDVFRSRNSRCRHADIGHGSTSNDRNDSPGQHHTYRASCRYGNSETLEHQDKRYHGRRKGGFNVTESDSTRIKEELEDLHGRLRDASADEEARLKREISAGVNALQKQKPDFDVSGVLAEETNMKNGVMVNFDVPLEARKPTKKWKLFVFKSTTDKTEPIRIDFQKWYLIGKDLRVVDIPMVHPTVSKQHAVICHQITPAGTVEPFVWDLGSTNGTMVNGQRAEPYVPIQLKTQDILSFARSTREYVLLHDDLVTTKEVPLEDVLQKNLEMERKERNRTARMGRYW